MTRENDDACVNCGAAVRRVAGSSNRIEVYVVWLYDTVYIGSFNFISEGGEGDTAAGADFAKRIVGALLSCQLFDYQRRASTDSPINTLRCSAVDAQSIRGRYRPGGVPIEGTQMPDIAFDFDKAGVGSKSIASDSNDADVQATFTTNATNDDGVVSFETSGNVFILHNAGANQGADQRYVYMRLDTAVPLQLSALRFITHTNAAGADAAHPVTLAIEVATSSDFVNPTVVGTLTTANGALVEKSATFDLDVRAGSVCIRLRATSSIPDGGNYIAFKDVKFTASPAGSAPALFHSPVDQRISIAGGVNTKNTVLTSFSTPRLMEEDGQNLFQRWSLVPVAGTPNQFNIVGTMLVDGKEFRPAFLSAAGDGSMVRFSNRDTGLGTERWIFKPVVGVPECFNIVVAGGVRGGRSYLGPTADGVTDMVLWPADDGSGLQRWLVQASTEITPDDIPVWQYEDVFNLAAYLTANPHRRVLRIFARELVLDADIVRQADFANLPVDIRIDCFTCRVVGASRTIDVSGVNPARARPDPAKAMSWSSYQWLPVPAAEGERGFDGGRVVVNAYSAAWDGDTVLALHADGGNGGGGQRGYPGRSGSPGQTGETGGQGGQGGRGGDGGRIIFYYEQIATPGRGVLSIAASCEAGDAGSSGPGGPGGPGGPPRSGHPGDKGTDGAPGPNGEQGSKGVTLTGFGPRPAFEAMQEDTQPDSLRMRFHGFITAAIYKFMQNGDQTAFSQRIDWLRKVAEDLNYDDVSLRFGEIDQLLAQPKTAAEWTTAFSPQRMTMRGDTLSTLLRQVSALATPGASAAHPFLQQLAQGIIRLPPGQGSGGLGDAAADDDQSAWTETFNRWLAQIPPTADQVDLCPMIHSHGCVPVAHCQMAASLTPSDVSVPVPAAGRITPHGLPFLIVPVLIAAAYLALNAQTAYAMAAREAQEAARRRREQDRKRREEEQRRDDEARFQKQYEKWRKEELAREQLDRENQAELQKDLEHARRRRERNRRNDDGDTIVQQFGNRFVAVLDSLEPVEGEANRYIAVFDGLRFPGITNNAVAAAFMLMQFRHESFVFKLKVDAFTAYLLTPGRWHLITLGGNQQPTGDTIQLFNFRPTGLPAWRLAGAPERGVTYESIAPLGPAMSQLIDFVLQYVETDLKPFKASSPSGALSPRPLIQVAGSDLIATQNVGMAAFHTFGHNNAAGYFAFDLGYGSPVGLPTAALAKLTALSSGARTVVISHWDIDHYCSLTNPVAVVTVQANCKIVGPSFGLKGPTLERLIKAICSNGPNHLFLVGTQVANFVNSAPDVANVVTRELTIAPVIANAAVAIPNNVDLALSKKAAQTAWSYDKNNTETITAVITGTNMRLLIPGDASFWHVADAHRQNLTHLEATHHGSRRSILRAGGGANGTDGDNDIPQGPTGGVLTYSYGVGNRYGIAPANVSTMYQRKGWTVTLMTPTAANGEIDFVL